MSDYRVIDWKWYWYMEKVTFHICHPRYHFVRRYLAMKRPSQKEWATVAWMIKQPF